MDSVEEETTIVLEVPSIKNRNFEMTVYIIVVALFWISLYLFVPTLPVYIKARVNNYTVVGLILSMYGLWQAIIRFPLGIASDRLGFRKPFILIGFVLAILGALVMGSSNSAWGLGSGRAITGLAAGTWVPLVVAFSALFPLKEAVRATAILTMVSSISIMFATSLTGWLNNLGGYALAFWAAMVVGMIGALAALVAQEARTPPKIVHYEDISRLVQRPDVLRPSLLGALTQFALWATTSSFTAILAKGFGASDVTISILISTGTGVMLLGNLLTAVLASKIGKNQLVVWGFVFLSAGVLLASVAPNLIWLFFAQYIVSFSGGINHPLLMGMSIEKVDGSQRASAMGLHQAVYGIGMFLGPWIGGSIADRIGIRPMFLVSGIICVVLGLLGSRWMAQFNKAEKTL
jgi:MFS family permease